MWLISWKLPCKINYIDWLIDWLRIHWCSMVGATVNISDFTINARKSSTSWNFDLAPPYKTQTNFLISFTSSSLTSQESPIFANVQQNDGRFQYVFHRSEGIVCISFEINSGCGEVYGEVKLCRRNRRSPYAHETAPALSFSLTYNCLKYGGIHLKWPSRYHWLQDTRCCSATLLVKIIILQQWAHCRKKE